MWTWIKTCIVTTWLLTHSSSQLTQAQYFQTINISTENGLPSNQINCIAPDHLGFLWLATNAGLVRWDQELTTFTTMDGLSSNEITTLASDEQNRLWIGTRRNGVCCLDNNTISALTSKNNIVNQSITSLLYLEKQHLLMIGTENGLSVFDGNTYKNYNSKTNGWHITALCSNDTSVLFTTSKQGMHYYHILKEEVFTLPKTHPLFEYSSPILKCDTQGNYYISTGNKGFKLNSHNGTKHFTLNWSITGITEDKNGIIWLSAVSNNNHQSKIFQLKNNQLTDYTHRLNISDNHVVSCLYADPNEGTIIIGLEQAGLLICPSTVFQEMDTKSDDTKWTDIIEDRQQNIWLTGSHLYKLTEKDSLQIEKIQLKGISLNTKPVNLKRIFSDLFFLDNGKIYQYNKTNLPSTKEIHFGNSPIEIFSVCKSLIIAKNASDLVFYNYATNKIIHTVPFINRVKSIHAASQKAFILDDNGHVYQATYSNIETDGFKAIEVPFPVSHIITDIHQNVVCADTYGNVYLIDCSNWDIIEKLSLKVHIPGSIVQWLLCDSKNNLWIGTDKGISMLSLNATSHNNRNIIQSWGKGEGYYCPTSSKAIETSNGQIWVLSDQKIVHFLPSLLNNIKRKPNLQLTQIKSSKTTHYGLSHLFHTQMTDKSTEISFSNDENSLMFLFDITNTINKERVVYQYRLLPGNIEWSTPVRQPFVFLSDLRPGNYTLSVQAYFEHSPNNLTLNEYNFSIRSPWYLSIYAWITYIAALLLISSILLELKIKQIRKQEENKIITSEKMALLKMEALQAQMNPHFIFNALNSLQYSILENNTDTALEFIGEFSKLIRSTLDNASQHFISLHNEIEYIENYMKVEQMRYINAFYYSLSIADDIDTNELFVPPMLLQPHIENAIKYAFTTSIGYIIISFSRVQDKLICMVEDNGIGRQQSMKRQKSHQSKSHVISQKRFEMLNQYYKRKNEFRFEIEDLFDEDNHSSGTRVTLIYPVLTSEQVAQSLEDEPDTN